MGEDREQEAERVGQEALQQEARRLALGALEGAEGAEREGLRGGEREDGAGAGLVRQGEVLLLEVIAACGTAAERVGASSGVWGFPASCVSEGRRCGGRCDQALGRRALVRRTIV